MSKNSKMARQKQRAKEVTAVHKSGGKIGRTKKLHKKVHTQPKDSATVTAVTRSLRG